MHVLKNSKGLNSQTVRKLKLCWLNRFIYAFTTVLYKFIHLNDITIAAAAAATAKIRSTNKVVSTSTWFLSCCCWLAVRIVNTSEIISLELYKALLYFLLAVK